MQGLRRNGNLQAPETTHALQGLWRRGHLRAPEATRALQGLWRLGHLQAPEVPRALQALRWDRLRRKCAKTGWACRVTPPARAQVGYGNDPRNRSDGGVGTSCPHIHLALHRSGPCRNGCTRHLFSPGSPQGPQPAAVRPEYHDKIMKVMPSCLCRKVPHRAKCTQSDLNFVTFVKKSRTLPKSATRYPTGQGGGLPLENE